MTNPKITMTVPDEESMLQLGDQLAKTCPDGAVIFLYGPLGAGKTTFTRGFLRGLGYQGHVKSPTYTLVEPYETGTRMVYHFDFYRVKDPHELEFMGIQDYFVPHAICLIEWPELGEGLLPEADLSYHIEHGSTGRIVEMSANTLLGRTILQRLQHDR